MKNAGKKVIGAIETGAGCTGAAYLSNKVIGDKISPKYHGPLLLALGLAGAIFIEEPHTNAIANGIAAYGTLRSTGDYILPKQKADLGLSGLGNANDAIDWDKAAEEAEAAEAQRMAGMSGEEIVDEDGNVIYGGIDINKMLT